MNESFRGGLPSKAAHRGVSETGG